MKRVIEFELTPEMAEAIARRLPPPRRSRRTAWAVAVAAAVLAATAASAWLAWV